MNLAPHLLDDHFADGKSESAARGVGLAVLFQVVEVDEESFELLF